MTCEYCFKHHSYDEIDRMHDVSGEPVALDGGLDSASATDKSTIEVGYSYDDDWCHGYLSIDIKSAWKEDIGFSLLGNNYNETLDEYFDGFYLVDVKYCPFCGSKLGKKFEVVA